MLRMHKLTQTHNVSRQGISWRAGEQSKKETNIEGAVLEEASHQGSAVGGQGDIVEPGDRVQREYTTAHIPGTNSKETAGQMR